NVPRPPISRLEMTRPAQQFTLVPYTTLFRSINGLPLITSTITIQGNGATITSNSEGYRILRTAHTGALSIYDTTISGALTARIGAGILNSGVMTITNSTISDNFQEGSNGGGGIYNEGDMTLV